MKRFLILLIPWGLLAQISAPPSIAFRTTDPAGACFPAYDVQNTVNGNISACVASVWTVVISGGTPTGTVTSVGLVGTANQLTVTGASPITVSGSWTLSFPTVMITPGSLAVTGHTTFEGVTSTGATGTGKLVYDTSSLLSGPTLSNSTLTGVTITPFTGGGSQCLYVDNGGVMHVTGSACTGGSGLAFHGSPTANLLVTTYDTTHIQNPYVGASLDTSGNMAVTSIATGSTPPTITPGTGGVWASAEGTLPTGCPAVGVDCIVANSTTHTLQFSNNNSAFADIGSGGGGSLSFHGTPTATAVVTVYDSTHVQTPSATTTLDSGGNWVSPGGASFGVGASVAGNVGFVQGTAPSTGTTNVTLYAPTSVTSYTMRFPGSATSGVLLGTASGSDVVLSFAAAPLTIASGTVSLGTTTVNSGTCSSAIDGGTATGVATTDVIIATANADPTGVTGYTPATTGTLYVWAYPTTNHTNFKLCNNTGSNITPGSAVTLNWKVIR